MRLGLFHWTLAIALLAWIGILSAMYLRSEVEAAVARPSNPRQKEVHYVSPRQLIVAGSVRASAPELAGDGPLVLVFVKADCPCSVEFAEYFALLERAYGSHARFLGVIDADSTSAERFRQETGVAHVIRADAELSLIRRFHAENGGYVALLTSDGTLDTLWPGVSREMMQQLGHRLAQMAGVAEQPLDLARVPTVLTTGCPYDSQ